LALVVKAPRTINHKEHTIMLFTRRFAQALLLCLSMFGAVGAGVAAGESPAFVFSSDPATSAAQHAVYDVVDRYQQALDTGDVDTILNLFAPDSVAEWNTKRTYATRDQRAEGYAALFKLAKFSTVFAYDAIDVTGDVAVVRTHHHKGAAVIENGKTVTDYNREVFVLKRLNGEWKIYLYTFNTDPVQGEG
jgi:uncharacterized protein (TIGR02246 family)